MSRCSATCPGYFSGNPCKYPGFSLIAINRREKRGSEAEKIIVKVSVFEIKKKKVGTHEAKARRSEIIGISLIEETNHLDSIASCTLTRLLIG